MRIINTFDKIQNCFTNNMFNLDSWRKYTKEFSYELSKKCEQDAKEYDFNKVIFPVVNNVLLNKEAALRTNTSFIHTAMPLHRRFSK